MLTTKQVRNIIKKYTSRNNFMYTNKTKGDTSSNRRVKTYIWHISNLDALVAELQAKAGKENVKVTSYFPTQYPNGPYGPGLVVKCVKG
jgi:hypothetical protein